jgi:antitoxin (DNA-binding transcriptional repressor) of toxin-antitoxin stability system
MVNGCAIVISGSQAMEEIAISKFKATCLAVLERVRKSGQPILVTRFGQPVAEILPPRGLGSRRRLGARLGSMVILGDIVGPSGDESEWEAAQDLESDPKDKGE